MVQLAYFGHKDSSIQPGVVRAVTWQEIAIVKLILNGLNLWSRDILLPNLCVCSEVADMGAVGDRIPY